MHSHRAIVGVVLLSFVVASCVSSGRPPEACGRRIVERLRGSNPNVGPSVWALGQPTSGIALTIPMRDWNIMSREEQLCLVAFAKTLPVPARRNYRRLARASPSRDSANELLGIAARICDDCWLIEIDRSGEHIHGNEIAVAGDALWNAYRYIDPMDPGVRASEFQSLAPTRH
jgi:hypothetical protein